MNGNEIEGLIGMLATFGILVLLVLPSVLGAVRERRIDRQIREARRSRTSPGPAEGRTTLHRRHGAARPA
ncbi:hypothetical protein [Streptomyces naphthomycinicus]|uniref:hypothetical protein n=1 Tax=Streptomyces naphthomycinicus TaxID=2872625 RepID=UPI001CED51F8|nr:hypothetical protein [Streptomyces sp. TML10]